MVLETVLLFSLLLPPQVTPGALTVEAEPSATVVWEGVFLGKTDARGRMVIRNIPPGEYEIEVSREGFAPERRRVRVESRPGWVEFQLERLAASAPLEAPAPAKTQPVSLKPLPQQIDDVPPPQPVSLPTPIESAPPAPEFRTAEPPTQAVVLEQKSSQVDNRQLLSRPLFWYLLVGALMAGVLGLLWRWQHSPAGAPPERIYSELFESQEGAASQEAASTFFLEDLRRREAMAEQGLHTTPRDEAHAAIDLDARNVRSVED